MMNSSNTMVKRDSSISESKVGRIGRIYNSEGGPLIGWLFDEARLRNQNLKEMSQELGVTFGYINQIRSGQRHAQNMSQKMTKACADYLGVPPIVVMLLSGAISMKHFVLRHESEEQLIDRTIRKIQNDPQVRQSVPERLLDLPLNAKKAMVAMYGEVAGFDIFNVGRLPTILNGLQRAAIAHDENEFIAGGNLISFAIADE